ncbi:MAG: PilN domain-containing protein [Tildeniella nuda ZEHNDER 1965/U140]|jgi:type IV pilus assembly protein PilN|nr:PilN domain-containing protein [Tildeniella nuda ZEHNDER 1965/U140]
MYSLDINFLNDRPEYKPEGARQKTRAVSTDSKRPLFLGAAVAVALLAAAGGSLLFLQAQNASLEQRQSELDSQLGDLTAKQKQIADINGQTKQIKDETGALASVFNLVKPWSAMMQEVRDRIPPGVQILTIAQSTPSNQPTPQPSPSPSAGAPPPAVAPAASVLQITGIANSFNDVNDFLLVLQKSNFLKAENTKLVKATLQKEAVRVEPAKLQNAQQPTLNADQLPQLPKQVEFQIETALSDVPASDLLRELDRKGAVGLVTRIEDLQRKGVIQP